MYYIDFTNFSNNKINKYCSMMLFMPYIVYAKNIGIENYKIFIEELVSILARNGVHVENYNVRGYLITMKVIYTDEEGDMVIRPVGEDVEVAYTASGGPEVAKGLLTGAATGGGLGALAGIVTGRATEEQLKASIAGAIAGGAWGAYKGYERGMREKISFAKLLARSVDKAKREMERKKNL